MNIDELSTGRTLLVIDVRKLHKYTLTYFIMDAVG